MAMALQMATFAHQFFWAEKKPARKASNPLRCGILSTAMINTAAIIRPVQTHADVVISAVASRDLSTAQSFAKKYSIPTAYGSYEELLDSPDIDFVYNALPNGMHGEWAIKALQKGKHVLLEKPFTANEAEARQVIEVARQKGLILMEAFHWQCHPAARAFKKILGNYGNIIKTHSIMTSPVGSIPPSDIRWQYDLGGGALMDMTYVISSTRYALDAGAPTSVAIAKARPFYGDERVDEAMEATLTFQQGSAHGPGGYGVASTIYADMRRENLGWLVPRVWELPTIEVELERATVKFYNFMMPHLYHYIAITDKATGETTYEKHYGEGDSANWSTYRWQLECFVDRLRSREPVHWVTHESSIDQMKTIDMVYEKAGLPLRKPTSSLI